MARHPKTDIPRSAETIVVETDLHAREAAAVLLKMAKATSDPRVAAGLIKTAAELKDQVGELPLPVSTSSSLSS